MDFVAIDVETANADMASICQIGLACCSDGQIVDEWRDYVDPEDYFDPMNVWIHGIDEETVSSAPTLPEIAESVYALIDGQVVVSHTHFDRVALHQSAEKYGLRLPECTWLDSARVARRAWPACATRGYGLSSVCQIIGYQFNHHDALEDAKAAAEVILAASRETGLDLPGWLKRVKQPIDPSSSSVGVAVRREGNPEGPLFGEVIVFTGALQVPRKEAADLAHSVGCRVDAGVTRKTTLVVVGDQDIKKLAGHEKSSKHRKAEELLRDGYPVRILSEKDFLQLVRFA